MLCTIYRVFWVWVSRIRVAPVGGEVRTLVNRRHRCQRERERHRYNSGACALCARALATPLRWSAHDTYVRDSFFLEKSSRSFMTFRLNPTQMCFVISATWLGQFYRYFRAAVCIKTLIDLMRCRFMRQKDTLKKVKRHINVCFRRECLLGMPTFQWLGPRSVILCCTTPPLFEPEIHSCTTGL